MKITIRIDDIAPEIDWRNFNRFKAILDKHGIKPLIGVIPDNKDSKLKISDAPKGFWEYIKKLQDEGWIVSMHGCNHLYTTVNGGLFPLNKKSEFAGYDYETQLEKIQNGKKIFESHGIQTDIFMAPSHSYDRVTLKALKASGFTTITDGFGDRPYRRCGLTFYPISLQKSKSVASTKDGITTFVYHPNVMDEKDFERFEKLFDKAEVVSYSEFSKYNVRGRSFVGNLYEYALAKGKYLAVRLKSSMM